MFFSLPQNIKQHNMSLWKSLTFLALLLCGSPVCSERSDLFASSEYINFAADENPNGTPSPFQKDVVSKFVKSDPQAIIVGAKKAQLDCINLNLKENLDSLQISWEGQELTAIKKLYESYPALQKRQVWIGELADPHTGTLSVVWNSACDPEVFHLSVVLNDNENANFALKSFACSDSNFVPGCTWIVKVLTPQRDELEMKGVAHGRALITDAAAAAAAAAAAKFDGRIKEKAKKEQQQQQHTVPPTTAAAVAAVYENVTLALDLNNVLKVLWLYTPRSRDTWGDAKIRSMITAGVTSANLAFQNSKINLRIECVGMFAVEGYYTNDHQQCLDDLINGRVPGVHLKRDQYKADLVQMVIEDGNYCGYGSVMTTPSVSFAPYAYSTVFSQCFSTYSHIHEIGHNLGCNHDKVSAGGISGTNYGWRYCDTPGSFRSLLAYSCSQSTRVPYFSSPNVWYMGKTTGKVDADNVKTINANKGFACNFRQG